MKPNRIQKIVFTAAFLITVQLHAQTLSRTNSGNSYLYTFTPSNSTCSGSSNSYFFMWVNAIGVFTKTNQPCGSSAYTNTITSPYATCLSVDKYGDDDDAGVITNAGSGTIGSTMYTENYAYTILEQDRLGINKFLEVNTVHDNSTFKIGEEIYLVITVAGSDTVTASTYSVILNYNQNQLTYLPASNDGSASPPPTGNAYFSFAHLQQNSGGVMRWDIPASLLNGKEKNIYVALRVNSSLQPGTALTNLSAVVKSVPLKGPGRVLQTQVLNYTAGAAYDPNIISVSKQQSSVCGTKDEWLDYTIHFQNIGSSDATSVEINLDLDNALDASSIRVLCAKIGTHAPYPIHEISNGTISSNFNWWAISNDSKIHYNRCSSYIDCDANSRIDNPAKRDICFYFDSIKLMGLADPALTQIDETEGEITFSVKTKDAYSSLHSYAGIVFNCNEEIITNLAVTTCTDTTVTDTASDCARCEKELKKYKHGGSSSTNWVLWLGWIFAGIFLLLLFFVVRKKKRTN